MYQLEIFIEHYNMAFYALDTNTAQAKPDIFINLNIYYHPDIKYHIGYTHLRDHDYCEFQPPAKARRSSECGPEAPDRKVYMGEEQTLADVLVEVGQDVQQSVSVKEGPEVEVSKSTEFITREQWKKIEDLEQKNAILKIQLQDLKDQLSSKSSSLSIENELLKELLLLNQTKKEKPTSKRPYSSVIQKFSLTMSTYSPKAYRYM